MIASIIKPEKTFIPFSLKIDFETQTEVNDFKQAIRTLTIRGSCTDSKIAHKLAYPFEFEI